MFAFVVTGCAQHLGNFTALSTSTYRGENIDSAHLVKSSAVGETSTLFLFGFIPLGGIPKVDQAVSEALSANNGDIMTNARLYQSWWYFVILGGQGFKVEGDVYKTSK